MTEELIRNSAVCLCRIVESAVETSPAISADDLKALAVKAANAIKAGIETLSEGS